MIMSLGLLITVQGVHVSVCATKGSMSPKEYVMSGMVSYPDIVVIRSNSQNLTDAGLIEKFFLGWGTTQEIAQARLKAIRDLTAEELEQKKKEYEMYNK